MWTEAIFFPAIAISIRIIDIEHSMAMAPSGFIIRDKCCSAENRIIPLTTTDLHKPQLFLLSPDFEDAAYPEQRFFCRHSALVEGVIASFPALEDLLDIRRVDFKRPRAEVVALLGEANQALPVLILRPGETSGQVSGEAGGRQFIAGAEPIIAALVEREFIPPPHP